MSRTKSGSSLRSLSKEFSRSLCDRTGPHKSDSSLDVSSRWLALASRARDTASEGTSLLMVPRFSPFSNSCICRDRVNYKKTHTQKKLFTVLLHETLTVTSFVSPCSKYSCTMGVTVFSKSLSFKGGTTVSYTQFSWEKNNIIFRVGNPILRLDIGPTLVKVSGSKSEKKKETLARLIPKP